MKMLVDIKSRTGFITILFIFILLRVWWFFSHGVLVNLDAKLVYIPQSTAPLFSKVFFIGAKHNAFACGMKARAFSYPLFLKLFGQGKINFYLVSCVQFFISIFSWVCFSCVISRRLENRKLVLPLMIAVFLVGLTNGVVVWDRVIATESLTISLFLWVVILFLHWERTNFKLNRFLALLVLVCIFFAGLRDTNPYFLLLLSIFAISYAGWHYKCDSACKPVGAMVFFIAMLSCFVANNYLLDKAERWQAPFAATFVGRLLCQTDQSAVHYFQSVYHMPPVPQSLQTFRGTVYGWGYSAFSKPDEVLWVRWMKTSGKSAYTHYLLTHPLYALGVPWLPIKSHFARCSWLTKSLFSAGSGYRDVAGIPIEIDYQRSLLFSLVSTSNASVDLYGKPVTSWPTIALIPVVDLLAIFALLATLFLAVKKKDEILFGKPMLVFSTFLFLSGLLLAIFIWHADSTAYPRHLILVVQQLLLSIFMAFFFLYDQVYLPKP